MDPDPDPTTPEECRQRARECGRLANEFQARGDIAGVKREIERAKGWALLALKLETPTNQRST